MGNVQRKVGKKNINK